MFASVGLVGNTAKGETNTSTSLLYHTVGLELAKHAHVSSSGAGRQRHPAPWWPPAMPGFCPRHVRLAGSRSGDSATCRWVAGTF